MKHLIAGATIGICVGIASGYGVARMRDGRAPTDVKSAWDAYVAAQRNYMAALKASEGHTLEVSRR